MVSAVPYLDEVRAIVATAELQGREMTERECEQCEALLGYVEAWQRLARVVKMMKSRDW